MMYVGKAKARWLFTTVCLMASLSLCGCGRSASSGIVKRTVLAPKLVQNHGIMKTKQDLSMARKLKEPLAGDYILGPEDVVEVVVFRHDELKMETTISASGKFSYFLVGEIEASGETLFELEDKIEEKLREYIKEPQVFVTIIKYRSHKIFVLGQVQKPGLYRMRVNLTLLEAISAAEGIGPNAHLGGAYVVRDGRVLLVNFVELIEKGNTEENIFLAPGDLVYIPSNKNQKVYVLGEVNQQSAVPMGDDGITLFEAIAEAGGFTQDADKQSIIVMRGNLSEPEIWEINAQGMDVSVNVPLHRGDVVYVASSAFANVERLAVRLSHILQPFLQVTRGLILTDTAVDILQGDRGNTKVIVSD